MMLSTRLIDILYDIIENEEISLQILSDKYKVSKRMIRYDIENLNYFLSKNNLPTIDSKTLQISNIDIDLIQNHLIPQQYSVEERSILLILYILYHEQPSIGEFNTKYNFTNTMSINTISKAKDILQKFSLSMDTDLHILGKEVQIRYLLLYIANTYLYNKRENSFTNIIKASLFSTNISYDTEQILYEITKTINKVLSDNAFQIINTFLKITLYRIECGYRITDDDNTALEHLTEYSLIEKTLNKFDTDNLFTKNEILKLVDLIMGSQALNLLTPTHEIWIYHYLTTNLIMTVSEKIECLPLVQDSFLYKSLLNHLKSTIYRITNHQQFEYAINSGVYEEVQLSCPKLYKIVAKALSEFEKTLDIKFSKLEVAFIVIYFQTAIDRNVVKSATISVLLVCNYGYGTSVLLSQQLTQYYNVKVLDISTLYQIEDVLLQHTTVDYIITTLDIEDKYNIPIIRVNIFLTTSDFNILDEEGFIRKALPRYKLSELLEIYDSKESLIDNLKCYFEDSLIDDVSNKPLTLEDLLPPEAIIKLDVQDWKEALTIGGNILKNRGSITSTYIEDIIQAVNTSGEYMVTNTGLAIPHTISNGNVLKTGFVLILLEQNIIFPQGQSIEFILIISSKDNQDHKELFISLFNILNNVSHQKQLKQLSPLEIFNYIKSLL